MTRLMRIIGHLSVIGAGFLLMLAVFDFPDWGDPNSPASQHLSPYYIEKIYRDTHVPNLVTAVLADYRGFDTMLETAVVFVAGIAILAVLWDPKERQAAADAANEPMATLPDRDASVVPEERDLIIRMTSRLLLPTIQLFALYVIAHGHYSPGGGFQGGVIMAASLILVSLSFSLRSAMSGFSKKLGLGLGILGVIIYAGTGLVSMLLGGNFLEYGVLSAIYPNTDEVMAHSHSMLVVEIGVGFTVMSMLFLIYANLSSRGTFRRGL